MKQEQHANTPQEESFWDKINPLRRVYILLISILEYCRDLFMLARENEVLREQALFRHFDRLVTKLNLMEERIMANLEALLLKVEEQTTVDDSIIALLVEVKADLEEALGKELSPEAQAKVDEAFAKLTANVTKVSAAVQANTTPPQP